MIVTVTRLLVARLLVARCFAGLGYPDNLYRFGNEKPVCSMYLAPFALRQPFDGSYPAARREKVYLGTYIHRERPLPK